MFVEFFIWKNGNWFDIGQEPAFFQVFNLAAVPNVGDLIQVEKFFKDYSRDWEIEYKIRPFLRVKERVFIALDKIDITLDGDNE